MAKDLAGVLREKIIIDTCNPYPGRDGEIATEVINNPNLRQSAYTAQRFPHSKIVKALNTIYYVHLRDYAFRPAGNRFALPIAGDDPAAKNEVTRLLKDIGFDVVDVGTINDSEVMEVDQLLYNKPMPAREMKEKLKKR